MGRLWRRRSPPSEGSQLVVPDRERQELIRQFHDSLFAGHLGITHTIFRLLDRVDSADSITSPYAIWVRDALEEAYEQVRQHSGQAVQRQKRLYDRRAVK